MARADVSFESLGYTVQVLYSTERHHRVQAAVATLTDLTVGFTYDDPPGGNLDLDEVQTIFKTGRIRDFFMSAIKLTSLSLIFSRCPDLPGSDIDYLVGNFT